MSMTVKELIEMLSSYPEDMIVDIDPFTKTSSSDIAYCVFNKIEDKLNLRVVQAETNRDPSDSLTEEYVEYGFDAWSEPIDKQKVLLIGSSRFIYVS